MNIWFLKFKYNFFLFGSLAGPLQIGVVIVQKESGLCSIISCLTATANTNRLIRLGLVSDLQSDRYLDLSLTNID